MTTASGSSSQQFALLPKGLGSLCFVQIFSTLSFSVLYSSLVLYMTSSLGLSRIEANTLTGFFIAFNYGLHLIGGFIGGRYMSNRSLYSVGMVLLIIGCLILSLNTLPSLYIGLAFFLTGAGLNVTCLNCMVTQRFNKSHKEREQAFFYLYSAMNVGFFSGFTLSGILEKTANYPLLFIFGAIGNGIALFLVYRLWDTIGDVTTTLSQLSPQEQRKRKRLGLGFIVLMIPLILLLTHYSRLANQMMFMVGCLMMFVLLGLAFKRPIVAEKKKMLACILLMLAAFIFWTLYQIAPMGLTLFIKYNVHTTLFGYSISPQWVQNVNTIVIMLGGPLISGFLIRLRERGFAIALPTQFMGALFLIGVGFLVLTIGIGYASSQGLVNLNWVILSYVLQSIGELLISPVGYAMIGQLAPAKLQGVMMGTWMMVTGVSATLSNYFSNLMVSSSVSTNPLVTNESFSHVFSLLGWAAILAAVVLVMLSSYLNQLINDDKDSDLGEILDAEPA